MNLMENNFTGIVKFQADWCGPCHAVRPVIEKLAKDANLNLVEVDIDKEPELAQKYGVQSIPTIMRFENGEPVATSIGALPLAKLSAALELTENNRLKQQLRTGGEVV